MEPNCSLPCSQQHVMGPHASQTDPVCSVTTCFFRIHFSITFPSTPRSPKWSVTFVLSPQDYTRLPYACYTTAPSHAPWFDYSNFNWWWVQIKDLFSVLSYSCPSIFLSTSIKPCTGLHRAACSSVGHVTSCDIVNMSGELERIWQEVDLLCFKTSHHFLVRPEEIHQRQPGLPLCGLCSNFGVKSKAMQL